MAPNVRDVGLKGYWKLILAACGVTALLLWCCAFITRRREPDLGLSLVSRLVAAFGVVALVLPAIVLWRTRRVWPGAVVAAALLGGVGAVVVTERSSARIHWARSVDRFELAAQRGSLPCVETPCRLGNWTGTQVRTLPSLTAVFVDGECSEAGGFLKARVSGLTTDAARRALDGLGLGFSTVTPGRDGWYHFCITT